MRKIIKWEEQDFSVYKIVCPCNPQVNIKFIGYTANLIKIKQTHRQRANDPTNTFNKYVYDAINEHGGFDKFKLLEIEKRRFKNKREAELYTFDLLKAL